MADFLSSAKRQLARRLLAKAYAIPFLRKRALAVLVRAYANRDITLRVRLEDHTLFLDPADDVITPRVLLRGAWQRKEVEQAVAVIAQHAPASRGKLFVDIGANIGTQTVYAMLTGFFGGAMAFEPAPRNFELLVENIAVNGLQDKVLAHRCGIGESPGTATLTLSGWNGGGHAVSGAGQAARRQDREEVQIEVETLPRMLARDGHAPADIGLVWIDVEGGERDVLRGMEDVLRLAVPVVIEHLPELITAEAAKDIRDLLARHYPNFLQLGSLDASPQNVADFDPLQMSGDFLFFRS